MHGSITILFHASTFFDLFTPSSIRVFGQTTDQFILYSAVCPIPTRSLSLCLRLVRWSNLHSLPNWDPTNLEFDLWKLSLLVCSHQCLFTGRFSKVLKTLGRRHGGVQQWSGGKKCISAQQRNASARIHQDRHHHCWCHLQGDLSLWCNDKWSHVLQFMIMFHLMYLQSWMKVFTKDPYAVCSKFEGYSKWLMRGYESPDGTIKSRQNQVCIRSGCCKGM